MSVIENPVAYMNETQHVEYDEETPMNNQLKKKITKPPTTNILDETPLTTEKNKSKSPRQLNQATDETADKTQKSGLSDLSLSSQLADNPQSNTDVRQEAPVLDDKNPVHENNLTDSNNTEKVQEGTPEDEKDAAPAVNFLEIAKQLNSDSDDEEYVPGTGGEQDKDEDGDDEEKEVEDTVARQYSLRDGLRGTVEEENKEVEHDDTDKKKADDLWSAFKADVAVPIKRKAKELETTIKEKTYDFAGESITVREEIKNKRKSIVSTLGLNRKRRHESAPVVSRLSSAETDGSSVELEAESSTQAVKRPRPVSKLNSLVNRLTKKPKMTVMNKTALDWENYKKQQDITDDVKNEAKAEGYLEKQDFLSRSDQRQYELEKEIRMQQQRRRQMMNSRQF